jgi:hypothetical protein
LRLLIDAMARPSYLFAALYIAINDRSRRVVIYLRLPVFTGVQARILIRVHVHGYLRPGELDGPSRDELGI